MGQSSIIKEEITPNNKLIYESKGKTANDESNQKNYDNQDNQGNHNTICVTWSALSNYKPLGLNFVFDKVYSIYYVSIDNFKNIYAYEFFFHL